jgi:hypothetical protein
VLVAVLDRHRFPLSSLLGVSSWEQSVADERRAEQRNNEKEMNNNQLIRCERPGRPPV